MIETRQSRHQGAAADIDEDVRRRQRSLADPHRIGVIEPGMALDDGAACHAAQPAFDAIARLVEDRVHARLDRGHID